MKLSTGTERYSREVIKALVHMAPQHEFRLYTRAPLDLSAMLAFDSSIQERVSVVIIRQPRLWTHIGLSREVAKHPPDALFIPAHVLPISMAFMKVTRTVVTIHDVGFRHFPLAHPWRQRFYLEWGTWFSARYATSVVVDSEATRRDVQRFYRTRDSRIAVAYPGAPELSKVTPAAQQAVAEFISSSAAVQSSGQRIRAPLHSESVPEELQQSQESQQTPYVLFIGTLQPRKNLRRLIQAWRIVVDSDRRRPLLIVAGAAGWGGEDLRYEAECLGIADTVRFVGYISDVEKTALLQGARTFAFPSLYEGFGLPVLEAQQAGIPVVCSNTSSLPEVAGNAALMVDPHNHNDIAEALLLAMNDDSLRMRLIAAGSANVHRFSWSQCAATVLKMLEKTDYDCL